jgi:hypothetical protein
MINEYDKQQGVEVAWHGLTEIKADLDIDNNWLTEWDVEERELYRKLDDEYVSTKYKILTATDNKEIGIGTPFSESYNYLSNERLVSLVKNTLANTDYKIMSVGSIRNRGRTFISVRIPELDDIIVADKEYKVYLNFGASRDKSSSLFINTSSICTVCDNTFTINFLKASINESSEKNISFSSKHTKNILSRAYNMSEIINGMMVSNNFFKAQLKVLNEEPISSVDAESIMYAVMSADGNRPKQRGVNRINRIMDYFQHGKGNNGDDALDLFQGVTEYYTHHFTENPSYKISSNDSGYAQNIKKTVLDTLYNGITTNVLADTISTGKEIREEALQNIYNMQNWRQLGR